MRSIGNLSGALIPDMITGMAVKNCPHVNECIFIQCQTAGRPGKIRIDPCHILS